MSEHHDIYLGRQPILDDAQHIVAYELLFRSGQNTTSGVTDDLLATTNVIINTISEFGIDNVLDKHDGYLNVSYALLMSDMLELLPRERMVLEILETVEIDDRLVNRCHELKDKGFKLALDDFIYRPEYDPLIDLADVVKFDLISMDAQELEQALNIFKRWPNISLLAEKVEDVEQFQRCRNMGFSLFQGYFFARPSVLSTKKANPNQVTLLKVLGQLMNEAEIAEIERNFKESPTLTLGLLRLVNSVAMGLSNKVGSVRQALMVIGRRQLQRWVQLLLYAQGGSEASNPLMMLAAVRAKFMENLSQLLPNSGKQNDDMRDRAFMTGILSLVDAVVGMKLEVILDQLNLIDEVRNAVLKREGLLGDLLSLVERVEAGDFDAAAVLLAKLGMKSTDLNSAQFEAIQWARSLDEQANN
jgi:EAL and modified HD-GYP domain-containing signal transduction protein